MHFLVYVLNYFNSKCHVFLPTDGSEALEINLRVGLGTFMIAYTRGYVFKTQKKKGITLQDYFKIQATYSYAYIQN